MILVMGAGLLGSWINFRYPKDTILLSRKDVDATDTNRLLDCIEDITPDCIINCIGVTERHPEPFMMQTVNAAFPHRLASMCDLIGAKLIQISTDCVFSGLRGQYTEADEPDPINEYGQTKLKGEIHQNPHLTVRTSFVGYPDPSLRGLLAWFSANAALGKIDGYARVKWNGLCVTVLADLLVDLAYSRRSGLLHLYSETVTKDELLRYVNHVYGFGAIIQPTGKPICDRTLASIRADRPKVTVGLLDQLLEMKTWEQQFRTYLLA